MNPTHTMITNTDNRHMLIFRDTSEIYEKMSAEEKQTLLQQWTSWYDSLEAQGNSRAGVRWSRAAGLSATRKAASPTGRM